LYWSQKNQQRTNFRTGNALASLKLVEREKERVETPTTIPHIIQKFYDMLQKIMMSGC